jgi:hypothetical protein
VHVKLLTTDDMADRSFVVALRVVLFHFKGLYTSLHSIHIIS